MFSRHRENYSGSQMKQYLYKITLFYTNVQKLTFFCVLQYVGNSQTEAVSISKIAILCTEQKYIAIITTASFYKKNVKFELDLFKTTD